MKIPLNFVGLASGVSLGHLGYTHCCIEDVGVLRSLPNIKIISPCDTLEVAKTVFAAAKDQSPVYIRLTGDNNTKQIYDADYNFIIGKSIQIEEGEDIAVLASGSMVGEARVAVDRLKKENINLALFNFHTLKPIDNAALESISKKYKIIITIEEHNIIGGLGSAVSEFLARSNNNVRQITLGINDNYNITGEYEDILDKAGLSSDKIFLRLLKEFKKL